MDALVQDLTTKRITIEVRIDAINLIPVVTQIMEWFNQHQGVPHKLRCVIAGSSGLTVHAEFDQEAEAESFRYKLTNFTADFLYPAA